MRTSSAAGSSLWTAYRPSILLPLICENSLVPSMVRAFTPMSFPSATCGIVSAGLRVPPKVHGANPQPRSVATRREMPRPCTYTCTSALSTNAQRNRSTSSSVPSNGSVGFFAAACVAPPLPFALFPNRSRCEIPSASQIVATSQPAWQRIKMRPLSALMDRDGFLSSCAGHRATQPPRLLSRVRVCRAAP